MDACSALGTELALKFAKDSPSWVALEIKHGAKRRVRNSQIWKTEKMKLAQVHFQISEEVWSILQLLQGKERMVTASVMVNLGLMHLNYNI